MNTEINKTTKKDLYMIDPRNIVVQEGFNARSDFGNIAELAEQIKEQGVLNPISVQRYKDENGEEKYRLVDGERRYRAVMMLINEAENNGTDSIKRIPAIFLSNSLTEEELLVQQAMRNEGKPFNGYEYGVWCRKLRDKFGYTTAEIAKKLGKNQGMITYWLQIMEMKPELQKLIKEGTVTDVDVRKILQANYKDENVAVAEIEKAKEKAAEKGKAKITLKDLDVNSRTIVFKDSKEIKYGLRKLFDYLAKYTNENGELEVAIDLKEILDELNKDRTITEILDEVKQKAFAEAV